MRVPILAALIGFMAMAGTLTLPASAAHARQDDGYNDWLIAMAKAAGADPKYNRIPLNTDAQTESFVELTHQLYRKQMSADQYRAAVSAQYPGHDYEIGFIIAKLP